MILNILRFSLCLLLVSPIAMADIMDSEIEPEELGVYYFHEHMSDADVWIHRRIPTGQAYPAYKKERLTAKWTLDRFVFEKSEKDVPVSYSTYKYNGLEREGIVFYPTADATKIIQFYDVMPGSALVIYYGIDDEGAALEKEANVYFSIWIGQRKLKRITVQNGVGWHMQELPLGLISYLKRGLTVTFEVTCDNDELRNFSFYGFIYK